MTWTPYFGAVPTDGGTTFRVWATAADDLRLHVRQGTRTTVHGPRRTDGGIWEMSLPGVKAGARYAYTINGGDPRPDPFSRFQPEGVHGWSEVIDPLQFMWSDREWSGLDPARLFIYELHVGTFAGDGTFGEVAAHLNRLRDLGVTAIELMPLADFPGRR